MSGDNPRSGKHRSRATTPRGPERWARAAMNAVRDPNSKGALLYYRRTALAFQVAEEARRTGDIDPLQAFEFTKLQWAGRDEPPVEKRDYVTCSVHCTVMQIQLDCNATTLEAISLAFTRNHQKMVYRGGAFDYEDTFVPLLRQLDRSTLKRAVRCQACGRILPKGNQA